MNMFHFGVVEDRLSDPLKLGRCKVRVVGVHSEDKSVLPTEDLPWAVILQPTNSAANSGIGHSPTGIIEGTWVVVIFKDEFNQFPVIIGTLPGLPTKEEAKTQQNVVRSGDNTVWTDSSGQPITFGDQEAAAPAAPTEPLPAAKKPFALAMSSNGFESLKDLERLASLSSSSVVTGGNSTAAGTTIYSYADSGGVYTIGWGSTILSDGSRVTRTTTLKKSECDELLVTSVRNDYEKSTRRLVKVPLTQSMFDAVTSMIYNMGASRMSSTPFLQSLNAGKYEEAAGLIPVTVAPSQGLKNRRAKEQTLFLKDGIPQDDGTVVETAASKSTAVADKTENPVVIRDSRFLEPNQEVTQVQSVGFEDPSKTYPKYLNEPDTHRLARHERVDGTVVYKKESTRVRGVKTASGSTWDQPKIPYNARYPYNHVYSSESGHVQEFDDTKGNERIHTYHRTGTFTEIDRNGTRVNKIVGDSFEILERNGNVLVKGSVNITVEGDANIRVERSAKLETLYDLDIKVGHDLNIGVGRRFAVNVGNSLYTSEANYGQFSVDAADRIDFNDEGAGRTAHVKHVTENQTDAKNFPALEVPNRQSVLDSLYETPEEGSNEVFIEKKKNEGTVDPTETPSVATNPTIDEAPAVPKPPVESIPGGCDLIMKESTFTGAYKLTQNFTLAKALGQGSSGIPQGLNYGKTANEIVCNLKQLCQNCLEPILKKYPNMIITNSWRSEAVNKRVGGSTKSDHLTGCAADIQFSGYTRQNYYDQVQEIQKLLPTYHQLILEYKGSSTWIHVSYKQSGNKNQSLTIDAATNTTLKSGGFVLK